MTPPIPYDPSYEHLADDEAETAEELAEVLLDIAEKVAHDENHAFRAVHAKSHGLLQGQLDVVAGLPETYAQGLFARGGSFPTILRFSTSPGDLLPDGVSTPRGVALKVDSAAGEQDFLMVDGPAFNTRTAAQFLRGLKLLAATTDRVPKLKQALSATLQGLERAIEAAGGESATVKAMGGQPPTHILGETFFTQVPILYGRYMAKMSLVPGSPRLEALRRLKLTDIGERPNAIRDEVLAFFADGEGTWELRAQLCTDIEAMPIEDPTVVWPEDASPWVTVARLRVGPQHAWNEERVRLVDDGMSFSPWHALPEHRPLGSIMRVRKLAYERSAQFRMGFNGCPVHGAGTRLP